ncbi:glycosyltransferase family 2 protein [Pectinatus frisingensis]|uniref:glycosyltransferase family 2 protein n=1 Tax=Pectinatus frisingensis TaxID=865 RepID=UPI003D80493E
MPVYNNIKYIQESIDSVLSQTYINWELIIIDDASTMNIKVVLDDYLCDKRIKYIRLNKNSGVAVARNKGIALSKGRYIAFLDSDDLWLSNKLKLQLNFMQKKGVAFSYTQYRYFKEDDDSLYKIIPVIKSIGYRDLLRGNSIGCLTVMLDKKIITDIKFPRERHEDYILWLNILKQGIIAYGIPLDLARYRISNTSITSNKFKSLIWTWKVYYNNQKLSFLRSVYCLFCYIVKGIIKHK